jgi:hypothetical protein
MLSIKISRSLIFGLSLIAGLMLSAQFSFASDPIPIPKDDSPLPEQGKYGMTQEPSASAILSDTQLDVYFEYSVGDVTITVYDAYNNVVYQETVDTDSTFATSTQVSNFFKKAKVKSDASVTK